MYCAFCASGRSELNTEQLSLPPLSNGNNAQSWTLGIGDDPGRGLGPPSANSDFRGHLASSHVLRPQEYSHLCLAPCGHCTALFSPGGLASFPMGPAHLRFPNILTAPSHLPQCFKTWNYFRGRKRLLGKPELRAFHKPGSPGAPMRAWFPALSCPSFARVPLPSTVMLALLDLWGPYPPLIQHSWYYTQLLVISSVQLSSCRKTKLGSYSFLSDLARKVLNDD